MDELLNRYTEEQKTTIDTFWDTIRWTRSTGRISESVKRRELDYWKQFDANIVIEALAIHIKNYPKIKEQYTRGIMKNLAYSKGASAGSNTSGAAKAPAKKNRFVNFPQRDWDYEALSYLDNLSNSGQLTEEKIAELRKDSRYQRYLI